MIDTEKYIFLLQVLSTCFLFSLQFCNIIIIGKLCVERLGFTRDDTVKQVYNTPAF